MRFKIIKSSRVSQAKDLWEASLVPPQAQTYTKEYQTRQQRHALHQGVARLLQWEEMSSKLTCNFMISFFLTG